MHVFFQCPFAKEVWRFIPLKSPIRIEEEADFKTLMVKAREMICLPPTGIRAPVLPWICWYLWLARNRLIFEDKSAQPSEVATKCLSAALEWNQAQTSDFSKESKVVPVRLPLRQAPRQNHTICCFVDAAWRRHQSEQVLLGDSLMNNWAPSRQAHASSTTLAPLSWPNHWLSVKESQKQ